MDHLKRGGQFDVTYAGWRIIRPGFRHGRALNHKTQRAVERHLAGQLSYVRCRTPKFKVPGGFVCLRPFVKANLKNRIFVSETEL